MKSIDTTTKWILWIYIDYVGSVIILMLLLKYCRKYILDGYEVALKAYYKIKWKDKNQNNAKAK